MAFPPHESHPCDKGGKGRRKGRGPPQDTQPPSQGEKSGSPPFRHVSRLLPGGVPAHLPGQETEARPGSDGGAAEATAGRFPRHPRPGPRRQRVEEARPGAAGNRSHGDRGRQRTRGAGDEGCGGGAGLAETPTEAPRPSRRQALASGWPWASLAPSGPQFPYLDNGVGTQLLLQTLAGFGGSFLSFRLLLPRKNKSVWKVLARGTWGGSAEFRGGEGGGRLLPPS